MRNKLFVFLIVVMGVIIISRLFYLQIIDTRFEDLSKKNSVLALYEYPERGYIFDRNKKLIVANQPTYDVMVIPKNVSEIDTSEFCKLLKINQNKFNTLLEKATSYSPRLPSVFVAQISKIDYAKLQEKMWKFKGFYIQRRSLRKYYYESASNVLGYISEVNDNDIKKDPYYQSGELIGRQGIEKSYEKELRGNRGINYFQKDNFNRIIGSYKDGVFDEKPKRANDIVLTLDIELQQYGESLMNGKRGGIVAIEPESGEVLALISTPGYNPSLLVGRKRSENFTKLYYDSISKPLFDRGLQGQYPPGSPFKILNGLIALQENVITERTSFTCYEGHYYTRSSFMKCHCDWGTKNVLNRSIYNSCNTYFANAYRRTIEKYQSPEEGLTQWSNHVKSFGLGNYLGYDLPVGKKGYVPDASFYNRWYPNRAWQGVTTISNGIGQGEVLTTPIQLANMTAAIANRGYYYKPHFIKEIQAKSIDSMYLIPNHTTIAPKHFTPIIQGMSDVIQKGTARIARIKGIDVCGKTGTAENFTIIDEKRQQLTDHSIFIAFAPKKNPKIAIAVFVENGYWGNRWAAPIASLLIEKYINKEVSRPYLEKRMLEGTLEEEYNKIISGKPFTINE
ncbi:MAG: penicillin-binding protein 2 [Flavobacteriaceae bacterium]|nr:penicillin-binding protein 2 [Flavobacteriaceae bacterium]MDG2314173.1 penicillin-binding protein 2 [Flavobacteriaceae bacterium]